MKKSLFLIPALTLGVAFASCSSDLENGNMSQDGSKEKGEENYIAVNIVAANTITRAGVSDPSNYEDGIKNENTVNVVRLYFFDGSGDPFVVYEDDTANSYSYVNISNENFVEGGQDKPNVEKILTATASVTLPAGEFPSQVIAVINPDSNLSNLNLASLSQVQGATDINNVTGTFATANPSAFVMSNSVYANNATPANKMETVSISSANFFNSEAAAQANPVTIYVERVVGKVSMTTGLTPATGVTGTLYETDVEYNGQPVYVKFLGWNVTATTATSYLMKNINPVWPATLFGQASSQPWNYSDFFRSFWAVNPQGVTYNYYNFGFEEVNGQFVNSNDPTAANAITGFVTPGSSDPANYTYLQENAAYDFSTGAGSNHPSQVIIAAQLCDAQGLPLTIAQWGAGQYTVGALKTFFLNSIVNNTNPWKKTTSGGETTYTQISENDIEFVTAMSLYPTLGDWREKGRYFVYVQLTPTAAAAEWVNGNSEQAQPLTATKINSDLEALGRAKIWNNGYTYYYFNIRHLAVQATDPGYYGVVRNHIYKCNVNSLIGLGTPVYDPEETIYPEKPLEEDTYISAQINILSWRIVSNNYDLNWGDMDTN